MSASVETPNGVLLIFKLPFPNGSYRNGVCRALWAQTAGSLSASRLFLSHEFFFFFDFLKFKQLVCKEIKTASVIFPVVLKIDFHVAKNFSIFDMWKVTANEDH